MRSLHENTISCYINPASLLLMALMIAAKGEISATYDLFANHMKLQDYFIFFLLGLSTFYIQTLRYLALKYDEPGKLSNYLYLSTIYQLVFDILIF